MNAIDYLPFIVLGAIVGLDVVSFPQAMFSRPIVAATVSGAFAGDSERGLAVGAVLEMVALGTLPFGASRYPDWGTAAVVGGALYASGLYAPTGHLALAVLGALLAAWLSGESMVWVRHLNARRARHSRSRLETGSGNAVMSLQMRGLATDLLRGAFVTAVSLTLLYPAHRALETLWTGGAATERALLAGLTAALGAATIWMLVRGTQGARLGIAAGLLVSLAVLV